MAKIISFGRDAPAIKGREGADFGQEWFRFKAKVGYAGLSARTEVPIFHVRAIGECSRYERIFAEEKDLRSWMMPPDSNTRTQDQRLADVFAALRDGQEVELDFGAFEDELVADGFQKT